MSVVAVVLAAGRGRRFGGAVGKQFVTLQGRPVLAHSVEGLLAHPRVDAVWVVGPEAELDDVRAATSGRADRYVVGGQERVDSVRAAVDQLPDDVVHVLVHDAARPWLPDTVIDGVLDALEGADAVATVVPLADTVAEVHDGRIVRTPDRSTLVALQTPQGFALDPLRLALRTHGSTPFTDDVSMVAALVPGACVATVPGDRRLHKVTTEGDLMVLETWMERGVTP